MTKEPEKSGFHSIGKDHIKKGRPNIEGGIYRVSRRAQSISVQRYKDEIHQPWNNSGKTIYQGILKKTLKGTQQAGLFTADLVGQNSGGFNYSPCSIPVSL